jgi:hypothetical protein
LFLFYVYSFCKISPKDSLLIKQLFNVSCTFKMTRNSSQFVTTYQCTVPTTFNNLSKPSVRFEFEKSFRITPQSKIIFYLYPSFDIFLCRKVQALLFIYYLKKAVSDLKKTDSSITCDGLVLRRKVFLIRLKSHTLNENLKIISFCIKMGLNEDTAEFFNDGTIFLINKIRFLTQRYPLSL